MSPAILQCILSVVRALPCNRKVVGSNTASVITEVASAHTASLGELKAQMLVHTVYCAVFHVRY